MKAKKSLSPARRAKAALLALFLLFFLASCNSWRPQAPSAEGRKTDKAAASKELVWPQDGSDLSPDPRLVFGRLDNGLRYVLMQNTEPRNRVAMYLLLQAGSLFEEANESGTAHYLEHMLFNGSENFAPGEMVHYMQKIGMRFGPDVNAYTGWDETVYHLILPTGSEESLGEGLTAMADFAGGALLLPAEIDRERGIIQAEKKQRDSVSYRTFVANMNFLLPGTRAATRMPIGDEKVIAAADQELLKGFYDAWYRPERMVLVVVGDFDPALCAGLIEKRMGALKARAPERPLPPENLFSHRGDKFFYHHEPEAGNTEVGIEVCYNVPERRDSVALQTEYLLRNMADAVVQNRLDEMKEKPDCPYTSASLSTGVFLKVVAFSEMSAKCGPENWDKALALLDKTLRQALRYGFTEEEVERVKKDYLAQLKASVLKENTRESTALARMLVGLTNDGKVATSPSQDLEVFGPVISSLTPEMLHKALVEAWEPGQRLVQVSGNVDIAGGEEGIRAAYEEARARAVEAPVIASGPEFPFFALPEEIAEPQERKEIADLGITTLRFENGVTVNIKKTDFKENEILFTLDFGYGQSSQPLDKPGLTVLAPSVVNDSGLGPLSREDLNRALAGTVTRASFGVRESSFRISGSSVPEEAELLFQVLYAYATEPSVRQDAYDRAMERFGQAYQALSHQVEGVLRMRADNFFADGDPRFGMPEREVFAKLSAQDVSDWVKPALTKEPLELNLVGDLDAERMAELAGRYLGSLPPRRAAEPPQDLTIGFPDEKELVLSVPTELSKAVLQVAYKSADIWDINRTRRLALLGQIFSERMREGVREKESLSYSPQAWNEPSRAYPGYGLFQAQAVLDPDFAPKVSKNIEEIAEDIRENGVNEDELNRARTPIVTSIKDLVRTNSYWLSTVLSGSSLHPQQLSWARTMLADYSSITAGELQALAREYLLPENRAEILVKPEAPAPEEKAQ